MGRLWGSSIVTLPVALPMPCKAAPDDIGNSPFWLELRPRYNPIEETDRLLTTDPEIRKTWLTFTVTF